MPRPPEVSNFKAVPLPEPQTTVARCVTMIDIGTVAETYMNETKIQRKLWIAWELPKLLAVFNEDVGEQPFIVGIEVTFSTDDRSNFSKIISNWRNKPLNEEEKKTFDPVKVVGKTAMISFIHARKSKYKNMEISAVTNENTILKFNGIQQLPKDIPTPPMISNKLVWDWDLIEKGEKKFLKEEFEKIPKWIREKMMTSEEFRKYGKGYDEAEENNSATVPDAPDEPVETDEQGW